MRAAREVARTLLKAPGAVRGFAAEASQGICPGHAGPETTHHSTKWFFRRAAEKAEKAGKQSQEEIKKGLRGDMIGAVILGIPAIGGFTYDLIWGLEEHDHNAVIPPYPWMRLRTRQRFPWGEDGLFEEKEHPSVAPEWPIPEDSHFHIRGQGHGHGAAH